MEGGLDMSAAYEQERMVRRQVKHEEKEQRRQLRRESLNRHLYSAETQKMKQAQQDSQSMIQMFTGLNLLLALMWTFALAGDKWAQAQFAGNGFTTLYISTSVFQSHVDILCWDVFLADPFCKGAKALEGDHSLHEVVQIAAALSSHMGDLFNRIYMLSFFLLITIGLTQIAYVFAAWFGYYYWYRARLPEIRQWALRFNVAAPMVSTCGIIFWAMACPDLSELPRQLNNLVGAPTGQFISWNAQSIFPFGRTYIYTIFLCIANWTSLAMWPLFFKKHEKEYEDMMSQEIEQQRLEEEVAAIAMGLDDVSLQQPMMQPMMQPMQMVPQGMAVPQPMMVPQTVMPQQAMVVPTVMAPQSALPGMQPSF